MISAQKLSKRFGTFTAVDSVSFEVQPGEIIGFIGPNGAGKTTTMRMLTGFLPASAGRVMVAGHDVFEENMAVRRKVGYLPETPPLYPELTIGNYLSFIAEIREVPAKEATRRVGEVMELVGLSGWEARILGSLSKGYRQRVGLAQAVLHDPEVLILDEPTSGLDPGQVVGIRDFIQGLAEDRTVILSTHILPEVERLCPRVIMINRGQIVADDTMDGVRQHAGGGIRYRVQLKGNGEENLPVLLGALPEIDQVIPGTSVEGFQEMEIRAPEDPRTVIARMATEKGWAVRTMERVTPSLEEAFLAIIGRER
ncbi:MAG: ATP-binding cassette domain-containing protein [Myxococcota bacterium]